MRIISIRTVIVGNPWKNWIYVIVDTSEGISGIGEATAGLMTRPVEAAVHELSALCIGKDPRLIHRLWDEIYKAAYLTRNSSQLHAMAGIEFACWDILGKSLGVPVHTLLGGKIRDEVRVYANGWYTGDRSPDSYARAARQVVDMGFTALKLDPFGDAYHHMSAAAERTARAIMEAVREAVGLDVDVMVEGHDRFTVSSALEIARWLEPIEPRWFEAPVLSSDIDALVAVARNSPVPVAAGERFNTTTEFSRLLAHGCIDLIQPEPLNLGGIWKTIQVASLAEAVHANLAIHNAESPVKTLIAAHLCAVIPNIFIQECFDQFLEPWVGTLFDGMAEVKDGYLTIPDRPGIGIELNEREASRHPYGPDNFLRLFQSGWERRAASRD